MRPAADKTKRKLCKTGVAASQQRAALFNLLEKCGGLPTAATVKMIFPEVSKGVDWSWPGRIMPAKSESSGKGQDLRTLAFSGKRHQMTK